jgi:hypothetical protein
MSLEQLREERKRVMTALRLLGRAEILAPADTKYDIVATPEWGEGSGVRVRSLTAGELETYQNSLWSERVIDKTVLKFQTNDGKSRARMTSIAVVDQDGKRILTDADVDALNEKSSAPIGRICDAVLKLSNATPEAAKQLGEVSAAPPSGSSASS